ncbi:MAG TPA: ubiquinol oxidase subunit II [Modicisalibacter sp.]|nr:ubiquinol oxidase subunit II [Modicisalibacter sp.]
MRRKRWFRVASLVSLVALPLLLAGCESALMDPKGQVGEEEKRLILTAFGLMLIVVIPVIVMTLLFAWRYRRGNKTATYHPEWAHSTKIEAVVWFIPCVIIAFLAVLTWFTTHALDPNDPLEVEGDPIKIQAISLDWKWLFIYPEQGIATVNQIVFPEDVPLHFSITSGSVMNALFIPRLGSQIYAMAGMDTDLYLIADEQGVYHGMSTNYSGAGFSYMDFTAEATSRQEFEQWVEEVRQAPQSMSMDTYLTLAEPTIDHPVEYFSPVEPGLYQDILGIFRHGEHDMAESGHHMPMSAEAAE